MSTTETMMLICLIGIIVGFILILIDVRRSAYEKGLREGWHRGRTVRPEEFYKE